MKYIVEGNALVDIELEDNELGKANSYYIPEGVEKVRCKENSEGYIFDFDLIQIPASVTSIDITAFNASGSRRNIVVSEGNSAYKSVNDCLVDINEKCLVLGCEDSIIPSDGSVTNIGACAFNGLADMKSIDIPEGITEIEYAAFAGTGIDSIHIPPSVKYISPAALSNTLLKSITVDERNQNYYSQDGCLIERTTNTLLAVFNKETVIIPDGVEKVAANTLMCLFGCRTVVIPASVKMIAASNFFACGYYTEKPETSGSFTKEGIKIKAPKGSYAYDYARSLGIEVIDN